MNKTNAAADLVLRYLIARALFRGKTFRPPKNLEYQITGGVRYFAGVLLNEVAMRSAPAIVYDRKDPDFWAAVIGGDDSATDMDPADLNEVRRAVLSGEGTLPLPMASEVVTGKLKERILSRASNLFKRAVVLGSDPAASAG